MGWLAAALALILAPTGAAVDAQTEPLPIRRVWLPPERIPQEMNRVRQGVLKHLPEREFEDLIARANRARASVRNPPQLVEAQYRASLREGALVGTGVWNIDQPGRCAGVLPVQSCTLALREVRIDQEEAILGDLLGQGPALLVAQGGSHAVTFGWTARGDASPEGLHFELQFPASPVASFELALPADRVPNISRDDCLLTGPLPATEAGLRLWRLNCSGRAKLDLVVGQKGGPGQPPPLILSRCQSRYELAMDVVEAEFEWQLEVLRQSLRELAFQCDPTLQPHDVTCRNVEIEGWELRPGGSPGAPATLRVRFRDPLQGLLPPLRIRCQVSPESGPGKPQAGRQSVWKCPGLHLEDSVERGETISVRVPSDVRLEDWASGGFHLTRAVTEPTGVQVLTLTAAVQEPSPGLGARPSARVRLQEVGWRAKQHTWWQIGPQASEVTSQITYEVARGQLFRLAVRVPPGWRAEHAELSPPDLLRGWNVLGSEPGRTTLVADLQQAVTPGHPVRLTVGLRAMRAEATDDVPGSGTTVALPDLLPEGTQVREGLLAISVDPSHEATVRTSAPAESRESAVRVDPRWSKPWGAQIPDLVFRLQRRPLTGTLRLQARNPRVRAQCTCEVVVAGGSAALRTRLALAPEVGQTTSVDYATSAGTDHWTWVVAKGTNRVRQVERLETVEALAGLLGLGTCHPAHLVGLPAIRCPGSLWRLTLAEPLREPVELEATTELPSSSDPGPTLFRHWEVPLVLVPAADRAEGEVLVRLAGADPVEIDGSGLREQAVGTKGTAPWRRFSYRRAPVRLRLRNQVSPTFRSAETTADRAHLASYVGLSGPVRHQFQFVLRNWQQRVLPVRLPRDCRILAAAVNGSRVIQASQVGLTEDEVVVDLPVPALPGPLQYELFYTSELEPWSVWAEPNAPAPELPVRSLALSRSWHFAPGLIPFSEAGLQRASRSRAETGHQADTAPGWGDRLDTEPATEAAGSKLSPSQDDFPDWSEWEPLPGGKGGSAVLVVRQSLVRGATAAICSVLILLGWLLRSKPAPMRVRLLLALLAACGIGWLWLPSSVGSMAACVGIGTFLVAGTWHITSALSAGTGWPARRSQVAGAAPLVLVLFLGTAMVGRAVSPGPTIVWILPGRPDAPDQLNLLAPPELLEQLENLARRGPGSTRGATLLSARYDGQARNGSAEFVGEYRLHTTSDELEQVSIPLGGVELLEALLDGVTTHPQTLAPPLAGFAIPVRGRGFHTLRLRFEVRYPVNKDDREIRFMIPDLLQNRLRLKLDGFSQLAPVVAGRGAHEWKLDGETATLMADLGRISSILVRWHHPGQKASPAIVQVKEAHLWELHPGDSRLLSVLQYGFSRGVKDRLIIEVPEPLEVRRVETGMLPGGGPVPRLKDWRLATAGAGRQLQLEFQSMVTDGIQVFLELLPRQPLPSGAVLPLPLPQEAVPDNGLLAYRSEGLTTSVAEVRRLSGRAPDVFHRAWQAAEVEDPGVPTAAYSFQRVGGAAPVLRLTWSVPAPRGQARQEITWNVGTAQAELEARLQLTEPGEGLCCVEWELPPDLQVAELRGAEIRNWCRTGSRLQVWLQRSASELNLQLAGWQSRKPGAPVSLQGLVCLSCQTQQDRVHVVATPGLLLQPRELRNLNAAATPARPVPEWNGESTGPRYVLTLVTSLDTSFAHANMLTFVEVVDRRLRFTADLDGELPRTGPRSLTLHLRDGDASEVSLDVPPGTRWRELHRDPSTRTWTVELPVSPAGRVRIRLNASRPWNPGEETSIPVVSLQEPIPLEQWVALGGTDFSPIDVQGLVNYSDTARLTPVWPAAMDRVRRSAGTVWQVKARDWQMSLRPRPGVGGRPVEVVLVEQHAAIRDGRQWTHTGTWRLAQRAGSELHFLLPTDARIMAVTVDDAFVAPKQLGPDRLVLALPFVTGLRVVRLVWTFEGGRETAERPILERPDLEGSNGTPVLWEVELPGGYQLAGQRGGAVRASAAGNSLRRAEAFFRLARNLVEQPGLRGDPAAREQWQDLQESFYSHCLSAEQHLTFAGQVSDEGPVGQTLVRWLNELRAQNRQLAQMFDLESLRETAELKVRKQSERPDMPRESGRVTYWHSAPGAPGLRLDLISRESESRPTLMLASLAWLLAAGGVWAVARIPWLADWCRFFWPEQLVLLGIIGSRWEAMSLVLVVLGALARLACLASQLRNSSPVPSTGLSASQDGSANRAG